MIFTVGELAEVLSHFMDHHPVRFSADPQGGYEATRELVIERVTFDHGRVVVISPVDTPDDEPFTSAVATVADLAEQLNSHSDDYPVRVASDSQAGYEATEELTVELETFDGEPTVVIFPV